MAKIAALIILLGLITIPIFLVMTSFYYWCACREIDQMCDLLRGDLSEKQKKKMADRAERHRNRT